MTASLGAIILCGGRSRRMGRPKAWLEFDGETLLARVARIIACEASPIIVVAAAGQDLPPLPVPATIVCDRTPFEGPLAGLAEGLQALPTSTAAVFVSSCDVPLLRPAWIRFVYSRLGDADIALPTALGREQPLSAVYRTNVLAAARKLLSDGRRRPVFLAEMHATVRIAERELRTIDPDLDSLKNANTPEEFAAIVSDCSTGRTS